MIPAPKPITPEQARTALENKLGRTVRLRDSIPAEQLEGSEGAAIVAQLAREVAQTLVGPPNLVLKGLSFERLPDEDGRTFIYRARAIYGLPSPRMEES